MDKATAVVSGGEVATCSYQLRTVLANGQADIAENCQDDFVTTQL